LGRDRLYSVGKFGYKIPIKESLGLVFQFASRMEEMTDWKIKGVSITSLDGDLMRHDSFKLGTSKEEDFKLMNHIKNYPYVGFFNIDIGK
jgi:hypothetical protein